MLPRASASRAFTAQTMARVGDRRRRLPQLRSAFALVLALVVILTGAIGIRRHQQNEHVRQLRAEQQQIRQELEKLKELSQARKPSVLVGSSGSVDFVVGVGGRQQPKESEQVKLVIADDGTY